MSLANSVKRMALAALMSHKNNRRCKHVAFIMRGKRILSVGLNSWKTHPIAIDKPFSSTQCAELNACLKVGLKRRHLPNFGDLTMVVVRVDEDGDLTMSKPCQFCQDLIHRCGFKKVYYSDEKGEMHRL